VPLSLCTVGLGRLIICPPLAVASPLLSFTVSFDAFILAFFPTGSTARSVATG
jgi:ABC-type spermidine/putrescine transport system permease subunit II